MYNPEPYAAFFDAILIGEGEESLLETCQLHRRLRDEGVPRAQIVEQLASIAGNYVPSLYEVRHDEPCSPHGYTVPREGKDAPVVVYKRVVEDFGATNPLSQSCVPYAQLVHDRLSIEILRGCARGCRFCQAGMTYRPVRERSADQIVSSVIQGLEKTGYDEVSLTSLSTTDHSCIRDVLGRLNRRLEDTGIRVSIPSQRLDSFGVDMAESVAGEKKGGLTFAPEAGSQRMRDIINKNVTEEDLDRAAKAAFEAGWNRMKLYFMMGLPGRAATRTSWPSPIWPITCWSSVVPWCPRLVAARSRCPSRFRCLSPRLPRRSSGARSSTTTTSSVARSCLSRAFATVPSACITTMPRPRSSRPRSPAPVVT